MWCSLSAVPNQDPFLSTGGPLISPTTNWSICDSRSPSFIYRRQQDEAFPLYPMLYRNGVKDATLEQRQSRVLSFRQVVSTCLPHPSGQCVSWESLTTFTGRGKKRCLLPPNANAKTEKSCGHSAVAELDPFLLTRCDHILTKHN